MSFTTDLLTQYGYIVLFIALTLELIAFPLPGEILMTYSGFLIFQGNLKLIPCIVFATAGIITGITTSYVIGSKLGAEVFHKHGAKVHMGPDKFEKVSEWFNKYGNKLLIVAYFIPGVRHITGYFSGIVEISYKKFALNAYLGAILWSTTFILLGKTLGSEWNQFHTYIMKYSIIACLLLGIGLIIFFIIKKVRSK